MKSWFSRLRCYIFDHRWDQTFYVGVSAAGEDGIWYPLACTVCTHCNSHSIVSVI